MYGVPMENTKFDIPPIAHAMPVVFALSLNDEDSPVITYEAGQTPNAATSGIRFVVAPTILGHY